MTVFKNKGIKLIHSENLKVLRTIPNEYVDLCVTSPPYDNMKSYKDTIDTWTFDDFMPVANELYRVTKKGGVVVWIVGDATIDRSETGSSFKQALYFKEIGFNLFDTMIFLKQNPTPGVPARQTGCFEYMFVLSKGKPNVCIPRVTKPLKIPNRTVNYKYIYRKEDSKKHYKQNARTRKERKYKVDNNIWQYTISKDKFNKDHPATFPIELAMDHILTWTNEGDIVLDPFSGSGTVGRGCILTDRKFIGIEKVKAFHDLAVRNIKLECKHTRLIKTLDCELRRSEDES